MNDYSFQEAKKLILDKIGSKGWNVYVSTDISQIGVDATIMRGPASKLEVGQRYALLPSVDKPQEPQLVMKKLEEVAIKLGREPPSILINGEKCYWTGFMPEPNFIKVNTQEGHRIPYQEFLEALDSIVQVD